MSAELNVQVVKDFFAAVGSGNIQRMRELSSEDIEWIIPGENWPLAGTWRGHTGLVELLRTASDKIETLVMEPREYVAQADRVMMLGYAAGSVKATDAKWVDHWVFAITVRDHKVASIREYLDTQALARASNPGAGFKA